MTFPTADPASNLKTLLEYMRVKAPELNIRQTQLARIIFLFVILDILLFLIVFDGIGSLSVNLAPTTVIQQVFLVNNPRLYMILGVTIAIFFLFMRFGYLYYQGTKDIVSAHNVIGKVLPYDEIKETFLVDLREGLMQTCKSNYIVQTIVVFLYPLTGGGFDGIKFEDGPLGGSPIWRVRVIKALMISIVFSVGWFIAMSQLMMLVVFLSFMHWSAAAFLLGTFVCYYGFYFEYVFRAAIKLGLDAWMWGLTFISSGIILLSFLSNLLLIINSDKAPEVFNCRVTYKKIEEISPPGKLLFWFLFSNQPSVEASGGVPLCPLGVTK